MTDFANWLPRADEVLVDPKSGKPTRRFYQFLREISEVRLGGITGQTVPQVATAATTATTTATAAATTAASAVTYSEELAVYAGEVRAQSEALRVVAIDNALTGAGDVPPDPGDPPEFNP